MLYLDLILLNISSFTGRIR